jgi:hypothetical protein
VFAHGKTTAQKYNKFSIKQSFKNQEPKKTHPTTDNFAVEELIIRKKSPVL